MKLLTSLLLIATAGISLARDITIEWDLNPETDIARYTLYTSPAPSGPWTLAGATAAGAVPSTINFLELKGLPNTILFVYATASNTAGLESDQSEILQVNPDKPGKPGKPRIKVVLQSSTNLKDWKNAIVFTHEPKADKSEFFRALVEVAPGA